MNCVGDVFGCLSRALRLGSELGGSTSTRGSGALVFPFLGFAATLDMSLISTSTSVACALLLAGRPRLVGCAASLPVSGAGSGAGSLCTAFRPRFLGRDSASAS